MSPAIRGLTVFLLALPGIFVAFSAAGSRILVLPAVLVVLLYTWVWLRFRPTRFVVRPAALEIEWPLKRARIPRGEITAIRIMDPSRLRREIGFGLRIGAGGLWGGFGWLWTRRRGIVLMYISRTDRFVWIEREHQRPLLITPEEAESFVAELGFRPDSAVR